MLIEKVDDTPGVLAHVPASGLWRMDGDGTVHLAEPAFGVEGVTGDAEAFLLRTVDAGQAPQRGCCLGRLVMRGRLMTENGRLNERARAWAHGMRAQFQLRPAERSPAR
jgi:hypothetical protein